MNSNNRALAYVRLSGHVEEQAPGSFLVVVSATSERTSEKGAVLTAQARTPAEAEAEKARLLAKLAEKMRARGYAVLDMELE